MFYVRFTETGSAVEAAVAALRGAVDSLLALDLSASAGADLAEYFAAVEVERRRLESVDHTVIAQLDQRRIAGDFARSSTRDLLVDLTRMAPGEATARVRAAADRGPRRELTGAPLEPLFARVAEAQRSGDISAAHARVIRMCIDDIPAHLAVEASGPAEAFLVEQAPPARSAAAVARGRATARDRRSRRSGTARGRSATSSRHRRPEGRAGPVDHPRPAERRMRRDLVRRDRPAVGAATVRRRYRRRSYADPAPPRRAARAVATGAAVRLTSRQRRHPRHRACQHLARRSAGTDGDGLDRLRRSPVVGCATCAGRRVRADHPVFDRMGAVLCAGRDRRVASPAQRRVLAARDGGCSFPGCTRPPSWTQAHHVIPWIDGGRTDIDNLTLVCGWHHREFERRGWAVQMGHGVPEWIPPAWLDPLRRPRRNTAQHVPQIVFRAPETTGPAVRD